MALGRPCSGAVGQRHESVDDRIMKSYSRTFLLAGSVDRHHSCVGNGGPEGAESGLYGAVGR